MAKKETVCSHCIGEKKFFKWIEKQGTSGKCGFVESHGGKYKVVTVDKFAEYFDKFFRENYQIGEEYPTFHGDSEKPEYHRHGRSLYEIISEELETEEEVAEAIVNALPDGDPRDGDLFYDIDSNYENIHTALKRQKDEAEEYYRFLYEDRINVGWKSFCDTVKHKRRFFNVKRILDDLFGSMAEYEKGENTPIYSLNSGTKIFRARLLDNSFTTKILERNPVKELGAPPKEKAVAGRMNVGFIPVFYGAFDLKTASYEVRPSLNQQIVVGEFSLNKTVRVFDFTIFEKGGMNQPERHTRYHFIKKIHDHIAKPISPFERDLEYIPTQIVAEYLKTVYKCEAIIFKSSLVDGSKAGKNIVLFSGSKKIGSFMNFDRYSMHIAKGIKYTFSRPRQ